jgi:hypothetical protein
MIVSAIILISILGFSYSIEQQYSDNIHQGVILGNTLTNIGTVVSPTASRSSVITIPVTVTASGVSQQEGVPIRMSSIQGNSDAAYQSE